MPDSLDKLTEILGLFNQARTEPGGSMEGALRLVQPKLEEVADEAVRERDPDTMLLVVSLIHVLVEIAWVWTGPGAGKRTTKRAPGMPGRFWSRRLFDSSLSGGGLMRFAEILDAVDELTTEEQVDLVEIVRHRLLERRRDALVGEIQQARQDYRKGRCLPASPEAILREMSHGRPGHAIIHPWL